MRAVLIGSVFAVINGAVNMFFAFRYAGGLAQYWVILVAYPVCKATERLPRGWILNPAPFSPKEHVIVMTMAIAGSLAGTLGLSGSMLALAIEFDTRLEPSVVYLWASVAGFFGIFFGTLLFETLVLPDEYQWPFSRANAAFIAAFYKSVDEDAAGGGVGDALRVFGLFFLVVFCWFAVPNYLMPTLLTVPFLCWTHTDWRPVQPFGRGGSQDLFSVLSSGVAGSGIPGLGGWASSFAFGPSIIPFETTLWIAVGSILVYWLFVPAAFFGGIAAWPASFREFDSEGRIYNATERHFADSAERPYLSGTGMSMYLGVGMSIVAMFTDCLLLAWRRHRQQPRVAVAGQGPAPGPETEYRRRPLGLRANLLVVALMATLAACVVELVLPRYRGQPGLGMPLWGTLLCIGYAFVSSVGVSIVYAVTGQNFSGGVCILVQILAGVLVPGSARANIVAVMIVNSAVSQAMGTLGDLKTALYLSVRPSSMLKAQLIGATVGVVASASTFLYVLELNDSGKISLGAGEWPAVGAVSIGLNAKVFGEQGPAAVLQGALLWIVVGTAAFGVVGTLAVGAVPDSCAWKRWLPTPLLLGVGGLYSGVNFSALTLLAIAAVYQLWLPRRHRLWHARFQYVSTSGVNAGVGLAGLVVILLTTCSAPSVQIGPRPNGTCDTVALPAQTMEDVACWNELNGYGGCNTPWPSN